MAGALHVYPAANEPDPFQFEQHPLMQSGLAGEENSTPGSKHPLPGQSVLGGILQRPGNLARGSRISGRTRHLTVGRNLPARNA